jgi:hypothetical protein
VTWNAGTSRARYLQVGKTVHAYCSLAVTGAGTAGQGITLSLPVNAVATGAGGGSFYHFDTGVANRAGWAALTSVSALSFTTEGSDQLYGLVSGHGGIEPALSSGDSFSVSITYEAA